MKEDEVASTREEVAASKGRYGKVDIGAHFIYGQVIDAHSSGDYVQFQRGHASKHKPKWYHRSKLVLHPLHEVDREQKLGER